MKFAVKILALLMLWGVVGAVVIFIDPQLLKDLLIPNTYIAFVLIVMAACFYSLWLIFHKLITVATITILIGLGLQLAVLGIMTLFLMCVLIASIMFVLFLHFRR